MKYIITEQQLENIKEKILKIPFKHFNNDWDLLQKFLSRRGNPPYIITGDVNLRGRQDIVSLGSLIEVEGNLYLRKTPIKSLGNLTSVGGDLTLYYASIESLGNLTSVRGDLGLSETPIQSLGNLTSVGGHLVLYDTPISREYSEKTIRDMVNVDGDIYL